MASVWQGVECFMETCVREVHVNWMCKVHYNRVLRYGRIENIRYFTPKEQFNAYGQEDSNDCLVWTAYTQKNGYGQMGYKGEVEQVHRVAWWEAGLGDIPRDMMLDHTCYNRACFNTDHLRVVTRKQNAENLSKLPSNNTSGYRGVSFYKRDGTYVAQVAHQGGTAYLGRFPTAFEAAVVALKKRLEVFTHNDEDRLLAAKWGIEA